MKKTKIFMTLFLCVCMICSIVPVTSSASVGKGAWVSNDEFSIYTYVEVEDGQFPGASSLNIQFTPEENQAAAKTAVDAIRDEGLEVSETFYADLAFLDSEGAAIEQASEDTPIFFYLEISTKYSYRNYNLYLVNDGAATKIDTEFTKDGSYYYVETEIDTLGTFVVESTKMDMGTLKYKADMGADISLDTVFDEAGLGDWSTSYITEITSSDSGKLNCTNLGTAEDPDWVLNLTEDYTSSEYIDVVLSTGDEYRIYVSVHHDQPGKLTDDDPAADQTATSDYMKYYISSRSKFDVNGIHNGNEIKTTYANAGYENSICVNGIEKSGALLDSLGTVYTQNNVQFKVNAKLIDEGSVVKYTYTIFNNDDETKTIRVGNGCDVQIGDNDSARVELSENGQLISMIDTHTNGCSSQGLKYTLSADEDTPFSGAWIGYWSDRDEHYADCMEDGYYADHDSGLTFHWDLELDPGEVATRTCYFQVTSTLVVENPTLVADAENGVVKFNVPFTDKEEREVTLYYTLEGQEEKTAVTVLGADETAGTFIFDEDASSWEANTQRQVTFYAKDNIGYMSKKYTFTVWWPEIKPDATYYTLDFANTGNYFATVRDEEGSVIVLPADSAEGKTFAGWNTAEDGSGTSYSAGDEFTMTAENVVLYAQWLIPVDELDITAIGGEYNGNPYTNVSVKFGTKTLVAGRDYEVEFTNNVNAGTASARIYGGIIEGEKTVNFTIKKRTVTLEWTAPENLEYDRQEKVPTVTVGNLAGDDRVTAEIALNTGDNVASTEEGFDFKAVSLSSNNYKLPDDNVSEKYYITKKAVTVTWENLVQEYNGKDQKPTAKIEGLLPGDEDITIVFDEIYTTAGTYELVPTVTGENADNYDFDLQKVSFTIEKTTVKFDVVVEETPEGTDLDNIKISNDKNLVEGTDYEIIYKDKDGNIVEKPTDTGYYNIFVSMINPNYAGETGSEFLIGSFTIDGEGEYNPSTGDTASTVTLFMPIMVLAAVAVVIIIVKKRKFN